MARRSQEGRSRRPGRWRSVAPDLPLLARRRDFRLLWSGQAVSLFGSTITQVAIPYQVFRLTHSSLDVGLLGAAELIPLLTVAMVGGAVADAVDRRRLVFVTEAVLGLSSVGLMANALLAHPLIWPLYLLSATASALFALGRPSLTAMLPRLVEAQEIPAANALSALSATAAMIIGPAVGGLILAAAGLSFTYLVDTATFAFSLACLGGMSAMPAPEGAERPSLRSLAEGFRYVRGRPDLQGTYAIDSVAMIFGMPKALFPALALQRFRGGPGVLGALYAAPAAGALLANLVAGATQRVRRHGAAITWAVVVWGCAITMFGLTRRLWLAVVLLAIAGGADMVSGLFRMHMWNSTIPDHLRGRLAGIEWANVASGPLLGDVEAGVVAAWRGPVFSVVSGGLGCVVGAVAVAAALPRFWRYRAATSEVHTIPLSPEPPEPPVAD